MQLQKKIPKFLHFWKYFSYPISNNCEKCWNNTWFSSEQTKEKSSVKTTCHSQHRLQCCERYSNITASTWSGFSLSVKSGVLFTLSQYFICGLKVKRFLFSPYFCSKDSMKFKHFFFDNKISSNLKNLP